MTGECVPFRIHHTVEHEALVGITNFTNYISIKGDTAWVAGDEVKTKLPSSYYNGIVLTFK